MQKIILLSLLILANLVACRAGDTRQAEAIRRCEELIMEKEAPGQILTFWMLHIQDAPFQRTVHEINPKEMWEVYYEEEPFSQAERMRGIEWLAEIQIVHAVKTAKTGYNQIPWWSDVRTFCYAERYKGTMSVIHNSIQFEEVR